LFGGLLVGVFAVDLIKILRARGRIALCTSSGFSRERLVQRNGIE
jgi:hypothetical protein